MRFGRGATDDKAGRNSACRNGHPSANNNGDCNDPCRGNHGARHRRTHHASRPGNNNRAQNDRRTNGHAAANAVLHVLDRLQNAA